MKKQVQGDRFAKLIKLGMEVFHARDLANIWGIKDSNTLYTTLKRYNADGLIHRICKGVYSVKDPKHVDEVLLGAKIYRKYCYLSLESVLYQHAYLSQVPHGYSFLGEKKSKVDLGFVEFHYAALPLEFLFNQLGIELIGGVLVATVERAICDALFLNPYFHFDKEPDWQKIYEMQQSLKYPLTPNRYDFAASK
jgi:predicted transcriptional regulator of viral defense system